MSHADYAARAFGLELRAPICPRHAVLPLPEPGRILAVVGPSGSGKTLALRALPDARESQLLTRKELARPVLQLFDGTLESAQVLRALARAGLADGRLWCLKARHLSAGELRRLELARALAGLHQGELLIADEFDAHLDSITACVIAQNLRRIATRAGLRLAVSTHRPEVLPYLAADVLLEIEGPSARALTPPLPRDIANEVEVSRGTLADYARFERWHYLGPGRPGPTSDVLIARHAGRAVGIALFGYPHLLLSARGTALPQFSAVRIRETGAAALNRDVRLLQRVVVDPRFRGVGVSRLLIQHGLRQVNVPFVECVAQMGEFSDFLLAAGFERAGEVAQPPSVAVLSRFAKRHTIDLRQLVSPRSRKRLIASLPPKVAARLSRKLLNVARSRVQTGFGSLRGRGHVPESLLRRALARVDARPAYFLYRRGAP